MASTAESAIRRTYIGGHDAPAIVGISPWESPLSVFYRKLGKIPDEPKDPDKAKWGLRLEPAILAGYAEERGVALRKGSRIMDPRVEFFGASPDALVVEAGKTDIGGGVDAKAVEPRTLWKWGEAHEGADGVPDHLHGQAQWYMGVSSLPWWEVAALFGSSELRIYRIPRNEEIIGWLREESEKFWRDHVLTGKPPRADGHEATTEALKKMFPKAAAAPKASTIELDEIALRLVEAEVRAERAGLEVEACKNLIKAFLGESEAVVGDNWRATWREQVAELLDVKAIRTAAEAKDPIALEVLKRWVKESPSRPLRFSHEKRVKAKKEGAAKAPEGK